ncbi:MAG: SMC-Scp complex subunit ScpB [Acidobacteria bacterium]|nr:SMC-Scp complex subunit ScpB [Acidobacteriota bacterium]
MSSDERKAALEAIIYAADEPATIEQLAKALGEPKAEVQVALDELIASYAADNRGIEIRGVAGGYKMYTKPQHHDLVRRFIKSLRPPLRLTMPALETLAVISYKQPVTAPEIQEIRGVNTSGVIKTLLDKKLITTAGRKEVIGRPILYRTSKEFLMRFGLSDLGELPSLKEFEALAREALGTDEGVAEGETGDESVLDSVEPTEAEAAAELEAEAAADSGAIETGETATPKAEAAAAGSEDYSIPRQFEQSISTDVAEAIAAHTAEMAATSAGESKPSDAVAESPEPASEAVEAISEKHHMESLESADPQAQHTDAVGTESESHGERASTEQPSEVEPISAHSEFYEPAFAQSETPPADSISMDTTESPTAAMEYESSTDAESAAHEISDEILAQLTQGIEIEVSADSLAALSSSDVPAEEAPAQFYSSDAEPEREPLPTAQASENAEEQSSEQATSENESPSEPEKSRGAAAGE